MAFGARGVGRRENRLEELSMIYFLALVPATLLTIAGYGVLFLAHRSEGALKSFGRYLSFWAFTLAGLLILGALVAAARGESMHAMMMRAHAEGESMPQCPYMHTWRHAPPAGAPQASPRRRQPVPRRRPRSSSDRLRHGCSAAGKAVLA